jgi:DNA repair exonuclease SbcCD ATPase subunit
VTEHGKEAKSPQDSQVRPPHTPLIVEENAGTFWSLVSEFRQAENLLKTAEWDDLRLDIPTINELRYAGYHLINALETSDLREQLQEFEKGVHHCRRASYDAIELGLINELEQVMDFENDYRLVPVPNVLPDYVQLMERVEEIKEKLGQNEKAPDRKTYYEEAESHLKELKKITRKLKVSRTELNKHLAGERTKSRRWAAGIILAALGLVYAMGSDWIDATAADQQQKVEEQNPIPSPKASDAKQSGAPDQDSTHQNSDEET